MRRNATEAQLRSAIELACEIELHFEFQFESELAFISKFRSESLEFVLQFTFTCASDVEETLFLSPTGSRWALWWPELIFSVEESHFEPFWGLR